MKFLVCTDGSEYSDKTVRFSAQFAKEYGADLTILHVVEVVYRVSEEDLSKDPAFESRKQEAEDIVSRALKLAKESNKDIACHTRIAWGAVASEIVRIAEVEGFDGIAIGTKGLTGLKRMLLGSVADDVIHHAHCPVGVIR